MNWQETPRPSDFKLGPGDIRDFTDSLDQAQQDLFRFVYSGALTIDLKLKEEHPNYIDRWLVHGETHGMFAGLYVHFFGAPDGARSPSLPLYIKAGYKHDIGKVESAHPALWDMPNTLLTAQEQLAKWNHVLVGERVFERYEYLSGKRLSYIEKLALSQHHERLDGTGGPWGLIGDQISPIGRMFAAMDQIFSRVEGRLWYPPMTLSEAVVDVRRHPSLYDQDLAGRIEVLLSSNVHMHLPGLQDLGEWGEE